MYSLTNPALKSQMKRAGIFWNRFQISSDRQIFRISSILRRKGLIYDLFVDKNHLTNIIRHEGDYPVAVFDIELFATIFHGEPAVAEIVDQNRGDDNSEMELDTAAIEVVEEAHEEAAPSSEPVSVPKRRIIDAAD